jgi:ABC-type glycerol-3-phosphate transport system substrate-binding protein
MNTFKKISIVALASLFILTGQSCSNDAAVQGPPPSVTLNWWTVFKDVQDVQPLIAAYRAQFPNVSINLRLLRYEEFETTLLNALAEDRGPDIFTIHNTEIEEYRSKIASMPATTTMKVAEQRGAISKNTFTVDRIFNSYSPRYIMQTFLDQVIKDTYKDSELLGIALSMDTLGLYYNKALLAASGIPLPASTYSELQEHVIALTKQDALGNITQSGIALGTSNNIERYTDILSLLMMQNGTQMVDDLGNPTFHELPAQLRGRTSLPAVDALRFYTDFASPTKQVYNWNTSKPNNFEAFLSGQLGYFLGYAYHRPLIEARAPKLNYDIAKAPQIQGNTEVNFANYWVEVVSEKSDARDVAWNFLQFIARPDIVEQYLTDAQLPTATKTLVEKQLEDVDLGPFAEQLLTAQSWYQGKDTQAVTTIFADMINEARLGER